MTTENLTNESTDRRSFVEAVRRLASAQKSSVGAPAYSRFINRPIGRVLASAAYVLRATPNQVTIVSAIVTFSGIAVLALVPPGIAVALLVSALLVLGYALDSADGQLARLTGKGSVAGEWLDHMADAGKSSALHLAVLVSWFRFLDLDDAWLLVPVGYTLVSAVFFFGVILTDLLRRIRAAGAAVAPRAGAGRASAIYSLAVIPADYGLLCLSFLALVWPPLFVGVYTALFALNALILLASLVRWYRALSKPVG